MPTKDYKPIPQELAEAHKSAMRWLVDQGLTLEQIRELRWGRVDEFDRSISVLKILWRVKYDCKTGIVISQPADKREIKIQLKGSEQEWFFCKSKIPNMFYVFVKNIPRFPFREEDCRNCLYPLSDIQKICGKPAELNTNSLTLSKKFDTIKVSKLNVKKLNTKGAKANYGCD